VGQASVRNVISAPRSCEPASKVLVPCQLHRRGKDVDDRQPDEMHLHDQADVEAGAYRDYGDRLDPTGLKAKDGAEEPEARRDVRISSKV
jgi:hypothetical protein